MGPVLWRMRTFDPRRFASSAPQWRPGSAERLSNSLVGKRICEVTKLTLQKARKNPLPFAVLCGSVKDASCDIAVQRTCSPDVPWDWRRTTSFACFGACFGGLWQFVLHVVMVPKIAPAMSTGFHSAGLLTKLRDTTSMRAIATYVCVENAFNQPFCYFPTL